MLLVLLVLVGIPFHDVPHVTHARVTWSSDVVWIWVWVWVRDHVVRPVHAGINPGGFYALCMKQAA